MATLRNVRCVLFGAKSRYLSLLFLFSSTILSMINSWRFLSYFPQKTLWLKGKILLLSGFLTIITKCSQTRRRTRRPPALQKNRVWWNTWKRCIGWKEKERRKRVGPYWPLNRNKRVPYFKDLMRNSRHTVDNLVVWFKSLSYRPYRPSYFSC